MTDPIEGIWSDLDNRYTVAVVRDSERRYGDYVGVVLSSANPLWKAGEVKLELRTTAVSTVLLGNYYMANKTRSGTTCTLDSAALLKCELRPGSGPVQGAVFVKMFPQGMRPTNHVVQA